MEIRYSSHGINPDTGKRKRIQHFIYTKDEADAKGMKYIAPVSCDLLPNASTPWRNVRVGDYILTDDNYVIRVYHTTKSSFSTPFGIFSRRVSFIFRPDESKNTKPQRSLLYPSRMSRKQVQFVHRVLREATDPLDPEQQYKIFLQIYGKKRSFNSFISNPKVMRLLMKKIEELFKDAKVEMASIVLKHDKATTELLNAIKAANKEGNFEALTSIAKEFNKLNATLASWAGLTKKAEGETEKWLEAMNFKLPETKPAAQLEEATYTDITDETDIEEIEDEPNVMEIADAV